MKYNTEDGFTVSGKSLISEPVLREIEVLTGLLKVLSSGIVRPNDVSYQIKKLSDLEKQEGLDLSSVIDCCPQQSTVREAKDYKPLLFKVLNRIETHF